MFDVGFAEMFLVGMVGLIVVGPDHLPGAVRNMLAWLNRFRSSFDRVRAEIRRELHNDETMRQLKKDRDRVGNDLQNGVDQMEQCLGELTSLKPEEFLAKATASAVKEVCEDQGESKEGQMTSVSKTSDEPKA